MWIEKKSHYNSRVSLHEAPTKNSQVVDGDRGDLAEFEKKRNTDDYMWAENNNSSSYVSETLGIPRKTSQILLRKNCSRS